MKTIDIETRIKSEYDKYKNLPNEEWIKILAAKLNSSLSSPKVVTTEGVVTDGDGQNNNYADLFSAIKKIDEGNYGSAKNFISRFINTDHSEDKEARILTEEQARELLKPHHVNLRNGARAGTWINVNKAVEVICSLSSHNLTVNKAQEKWDNFNINDIT